MPFGAGWLLLGFVTLAVERRAKNAAKVNDPYISPLDGTIEHVPASLKISQYLLFAIVAAIPAVEYLVRGEYLEGSPWVANTVVGLYSAWVFRRGREPKIMEGFREFPDPPSLLKKP